MAVKMADYIANLGKSVAYATVDKFSKLSPTTSDLVQTNAELFKEVTHNIINYKTTYKRSLNYIKSSKIYEAADTGITSIFEDIQSGKLWNKDRIERLEQKNMGFDKDSDDGFTDIDFGSDEDFGSFDESSISKGDKLISDMIGISGEQNAQMISTTIARTSRYIADTQKTSTNILYTQNLQAYNLFNNNLAAINSNISKVLAFQTSTIQTHASNSKKFFEESHKLMIEQTALLRQLVENTVVKPEKQKENNKITYDDVMGKGVPDIKMYFKNVKKNFGNAFGSLSSMNSIMGEDSNTLQMLVASPLQFIPMYMVNKLIPETLEKSMTSFDNSLKGFFGSLLAKINGLKSNDNMILNKIGEIFGVSNAAKTSIETKNYNKGKVDWDGKSRKALIEVIPTYLSKILSVLSGKAEKLFDYDEGKFIDATSIKKSFEDTKKRYVNESASDVLEKVDEYMKYITFNTVEEQKRLRGDIDKILTGVYNRGGFFDVNSKNPNDYIDYGVDSKSMAIFKTMFKNMDRSIQLALGGNVIEKREEQTRNLKEKEMNGDSVLHSLFNGFNAGEFIDKKGNPLTGIGSNLLKTVDGKGNNIFFYLQNIWKELVYIKRKGLGHNSVENEIIYGNTSYKRSDEVFEIPDNRKEKPETKARQNAEREQNRFKRDRARLLEKDENIINISEVYDDKTISRRLGHKIELERIKEDLEQKKDKKKSLIDKLLEAESLTDKTKTVIEKLNEITEKPMKFIVNTINKVDQRMYDLIFGDTKYKGQDVAGILGIIKLELKNQFAKINNFIDEFILNPIKQKLQIDSMKDLGKKIFGMFGLDADEIKSSMHKYLFDKDQGLFTSIKNGITDVFKNAFEISKNSLKTVYGPLYDKVKDKFKTKPKLKMDKSLEDLDNDDVDNDKVTSNNTILNMVDNAIYNQKEKYYNDIFSNPLKHLRKDRKRQTLSSMIKLLGISDPNNEKQYIDNEKNELDKLLEIITRPGVNLGDSYYKEYNDRLKTLTDKETNYKKYVGYNNILDSMNNKEYKDKYNDELLNTKTQYTNNLTKIIDFNDTEKALLSKIFDKLVYSDKSLNDIEFNKLIDVSKELAKKDKGYRNIYDKLTDYSTIFSDTDRLTVNGIIYNNRRKVKDPVTTAKDFADSAFLTQNVEARYPDMFGNISDRVGQSIDIIKDKISDIFNLLKSKFEPKSKTNNILKRPSSLESALITNPEGKATFNFAQDLTNTIANWMYQHIPHYEQGGIIDNPQVATLNKGEVVLTEDNVKNLLEILNEIETGSIQGKSSKLIGGSVDNKVGKFINSSKINSIEGFGKFIDGTINSPKMLEKIEQLKANKLYDKVFNIFNINLQKALEEYTLKNIQKDKNGIPIDPVQRAMANQSEPFAKQVVDELYDGTVKVKDALFGTDKNRDKKKFSDAVSDVTKNITKYAPEAIGSALLGGGVSLITGAIGGPLLGAAVGAGISLTKNSEKMQNWLFGEFDDKTNERQGGVIPKNIVDKISKLAPDLQSYGIAGGLTGLLPFVPFGPLGGLMIGSSIAYAKNNEKFMNFMFGETGLITPEFRQRAEKYLPKAAAGAAIGVFTGPFGLLTNAALGAAGGLIASTDTFNKFMFGEKDPITGEYENGLLPSIRHTVIDPLKSFMTVTNTKIQDFIDEKILAPLKNAFDPIKKDIQLIFKSIFTKIGDAIKSHIDKIFSPITKKIEDIIIKPISNIFMGTMKKVVGVTGKIIGAPFAAINKLGNSRRKAHIRDGNADYMTAEERVNFRKTNNVDGLFSKDKFSQFDEMLVNMRDEDKKELSNILDILASNDSNLTKKNTRLMKDTGGELSKYIGSKDTDMVMKQIIAGDSSLAKKLIDSKNSENLKKTKSREDIIHELSTAWKDSTMSPSDRAKLLRKKQEQIYNLFDYNQAKQIEAMLKDGKFDNASKMVKDLRDQDNTKAFDLINMIESNSNKLHMTNKMINDSRGTTLELQEKLRNIPAFKDLDLTDKGNIEKYLNLVKKEIDVKNPQDPNITPEQTIAIEMDQKHHTEIMDIFKETLDVLKKIANTNTDNLTSDQKKRSSKNAYKSTYGKTIDKNSRQNIIDQSKMQLVNKKYEEIQNSNLPKELKNQLIDRLMNLKSQDASLQVLKEIKDINPNKSLDIFRKNIRDVRGIDEEQLKSDERFRPYFNLSDRDKDESQVVEESGLDKNDVVKYAKGGLVKKTQLAVVSKGEFINTPNNVDNVMQSVPTLLKKMNKNDSESKNIFQQMLERLTSLVKINKANKNTVEKIDSQGNVMKFIRNSKNDLVLDKGDSGTRKAIQEAKEEKESNRGIFSKFGDMIKGFVSNINPFDKNNKDKKKSSMFSGILDKLKTGAMVLGGITFLPQIIKFVAPVVKELWDNMIGPFFKNTAIPWFRDVAIPFLGKTLGDSISYTFTKLLPGLVKSIGSVIGLSGKDGEKSVGQQLGGSLVRDSLKGGKGIKAAEKLITNSKPSSIGGVVAKGTGKLGVKGAKLSEKVISSPLKLLDNKFGLKPISKAASDKAGEFILNNGIKLSEGVTKAAAGNATGIIGKLTGKIFSFMEKLFSDKRIIKLLGNKTIDSKVIAKPLVDFIEKNSIKLAEKVSGKIAGKISTAGLLDIAWAVGDFMSGYQNAASIIGVIEKPTLSMRLTSGLIKSLNGYILLGLIPENILVNILLPVFSGIFDKDNKIMDMRKEASDTVAEYNRNNGTSYSVTQYNKQVLGRKSIFEKAGDAISNGWKSLFGGHGDPKASVANTNKLKNGGFGGSTANNMIYYSQADPDWRNTKYGTGTMESSGCGPTSAAMVISSLTKQKVSPVETANYAVQKGYRIPGVGTSWGYFKDIGNQYGIDFKQTTNKNSIMDALKNNQPVIFSGKGAAPFTSAGHFMVGAGTDGNNIKVNDPVSLDRSKAYPSSQIFRDMATAFIANRPLDGSLPDISGSTSEGSSEQSSSMFDILGELRSALTSDFNTLLGFNQDSDDTTTSSTSGPTNGLASEKIVNYIKSKEGFYPTMYRDSGGVPTIGYGSTHGPIMKKGFVTQEEATQALRDELNQTASAIKKDLDSKGVKLTQNEFDALCSFAYNVGVNGLFKSNLYKRVIAGERGQSLTEEFNKFNKAGGQVLNGLVKRRSEEANIFASGSAPSYSAGGGFGNNVKEKSSCGGFGKAPKKIEYERSGGFGNAPSIDIPYNKESDNASITKLKQDNNINSTLIKTIINILLKISNNTDSLQEIVKLLADVLKIQIPEKAQNLLSDANTRHSLANILSRNMQDSNTMDNSSLLQILNALSME